MKLSQTSCPWNMGLLFQFLQPPPKYGLYECIDFWYSSAGSHLVLLHSTPSYSVAVDDRVVRLLTSAWIFSAPEVAASTTWSLAAAA